jgi:enolase
MVAGNSFIKPCSFEIICFLLVKKTNLGGELGMAIEIKRVHARQVWDSRGIPTVECDVATSHGCFRGITPSGTSAGQHEALELRDGDKKFGGKGVSNAVRNVNKTIAKHLVGRKFERLHELDNALIKLDGSKNKSNLGANAILSVSIAACRAFAAEKSMELFEFISEESGNKKFMLPVPQMVVIEGGTHAHKSTDLQEFMIVPHGFKYFWEALEAGVAVYHSLKAELKDLGFHVNVGAEGAFAPTLRTNEKAFDIIVRGIEESGYNPKTEVSLALDSAASEFYSHNQYMLKTEDKNLSATELIDYYAAMVERYPIVSIEDGLDENDWAGWAELTKRIGKKVLVVGDDLTVTNPLRIQKAIDEKAINAVLIKINQIGTISETIESVDLCRKAGFSFIVSHRSGETEDAFIADFVVGLGDGWCKFGAPARSDRTAKYNQLLRIEEALGGKAEYTGKSVLRK